MRHQYNLTRSHRARGIVHSLLFDDLDFEPTLLDNIIIIPVLQNRQQCYYSSPYQRKCIYKNEVLAAVWLSAHDTTGVLKLKTPPLTTSRGSIVLFNPILRYPKIGLFALFLKVFCNFRRFLQNFQQTYIFVKSFYFSEKTKMYLPIVYEVQTIFEDKLVKYREIIRFLNL